MISKVLTANKLIDGNSVWLNAQGEWCEELKDAFIARHDEAVAALEDTGKKAVSDNLVVDVAVIDVVERENGIWPTRLRERIRSHGPSVAYGYDALADNAATKAA
jgi:hypothetical protein